MTWVYKILFVATLVYLSPAKALETAKPDTLRLKSRFWVQDKWIGKDKGDHFVASAVLVGFGYYAARKELKIQNSKTFAVGFSLSFGVLKEIFDGTARRGRPSYKDLAWDIAGIGLGYLIVNINENQRIYE
ncbi:hypothetical protein JW935_25105 [candidate division KSB1 bacterium]|nr:hypothetical protein [candidate division KSB1 bacterium]